MDCSGFPNATDCMLYHLKFLVNTRTIRDLHNRNYGKPLSVPGMDGIPVPVIPAYDLQLFASFVAPDTWVDGGTPADIKANYQARYVKDQRQCMGIYGKEYGYDFVGNLAYGYIGTAAGFDPNALLAGAGIAQILDNGAKGKGFRGSGGPYGDGPEDQVAARMGIALYQTCAENCTSSDVKQILDTFRAEFVQASFQSQDQPCKPCDTCQSA